MAYVLGYWYADGSLEDASYLRGKYIRVTSVDREMIVKFKKWLKSEHTIVKLKSSQPNGKDRYLLRIGSHKLYESLTRLGLYPNKSLTITCPPVPTRFFEHFVRGYFDGDGCAYLYTTKGKRKPIIIRKLSIIFTSGSFDFLRVLCDTLRQRVTLQQANIYQGTRAFQLRFGTHDSIKLFIFMYRHCNSAMLLPRKIKAFSDYFRLRPKQRNQQVRKIFSCIN